MVLWQCVLPTTTRDLYPRSLRREVIAATPLVRQLQQDYPHLSITFTTFTPTGSERVKATFGDSVFHYYLPLIYLFRSIVLLILYNLNYVS